MGFKDASIQCNLLKQMQVSGDDINLHLDGNGEPHMVPESDDDASEDSYSCSSTDSKETEEYELDAKQKSSKKEK